MLYHGVLTEILKEHNNDTLMYVETIDDLEEFLIDLTKGVINEILPKVVREHRMFVRTIWDEEK